MVKKTSVTQDDLQKLEKRLKLEVLEAEKTFVDLQLSVGKMEEKVKEISEEFPKIKESNENVDSLVHAVLLGVRDFKKATEDLGSRISGIEALPKKVDSTLANYSEKLQKMEVDVSKISEDLKALSSLKDEISKNIESSILPSINTVKESAEQNKLQVDDMKNDIDNFASLIKSFQRTLELTDIDSVIKRFESVNTKMLNMEMQMDDLRAKLPDTSITEKELDVINARTRELSEAVVDRDARVKEIEVRLDKMKERIEDMKGTMKKAQNVNLVEAIAKEVKEQVAKFENTKRDVKELSTKVEGVYMDVTKRFDGIENLESEVNKLKGHLSRILSFRFSNMENELKRMDNSLSKTQNIVNQKLAIIKGEVEVASRRIENVEHDLQVISLSIQKPKQKEPITRKLENEIVSLREIINRLSSENKDLERRLEVIQSSKREEIPTHLVAEALTKIDELEEEMKKIQKKLRIEMYEQPIIIE